MVDSTAPSRTERSDAAHNHARILDAARRIFAARGLEAEMKDIAAAADVGVGTLYRHFESRDGLLTALLDETRAELLASVQTAVAHHAPAAAFRAIFVAAAQVFERFGALIEVAMARKLDISDDQHDEFTAIMHALLQRGIAEGAFRHDLDIDVIRAAIESVFVSGKFVELARTRGYRAAADAFASAFLGGMASSVTSS
jgi:AcrR family transcriptional regulator